MIYFKLTSLVVLLQTVQCVIAASMRGAYSYQRGNFPSRNLRGCKGNEVNIKVMVNYGDDRKPWISYAIYHNNGTEFVLEGEE